MKIVPVALAAALMLSACGGKSSPAENAADNLEAAADQSDPAAAEALDNAADAIRDKEGTGVPANVSSLEQNALAAAGDAQAQSNEVHAQ
jgi:PBP1b-binding outer membrane lipoprotein LpoB